MALDANQLKCGGNMLKQIIWTRDIPGIRMMVRRWFDRQFEAKHHPSAHDERFRQALERLEVPAGWECRPVEDVPAVAAVQRMRSWSLKRAFDAWRAEAAEWLREARLVRAAVNWLRRRLLCFALNHWREWRSHVEMRSQM